jgi:hypothetical protein
MDRAAVVSLTQTLWAEPLPPSTSAQLAELIALTKALQLSQGKRVNIYTDSKYYLPGPPSPCSSLERTKITNYNRISH